MKIYFFFFFLLISLIANSQTDSVVSKISKNENEINPKLYEHVTISDDDLDSLFYDDEGEDEFELKDESRLTHFFQTIKNTFFALIPHFKAGDTKHDAYISNKQYRYISKQLQPCDILFKRVNWQWSNNLIPGFWTHTAIYVGNLHQINLFFKDVTFLKGKRPSFYIRKKYPRVYRKMLRFSHPIIEAIPESGVSIDPLRHIVKVDYFAAIRPILSKDELFVSLLNSFEYFQLPYDYTMSFKNTKAMVCSQLVYQAFESTDNSKGLSFELTTLLGEPFLYPADIVRKFDKEYDTDKKELNFVLFYDGSEATQKANLGTIESFRKTWAKSRFSILQK